MIIWIGIALVAGIWIGWNVPQSEYAKKAQAWIQGKLDRS